MARSWWRSRPRGRDITVNAVAPGPTATVLFLDGKDEATIDRMAKLNPMERLARRMGITGLLEPAEAGPGSRPPGG